MGEDDAGRRDLPPLDPGRYGDFRVAGEGGMGIVYWALDNDLNRQVAFKVVRAGADPSVETPDRPQEVSSPEPDSRMAQAFETLSKRFLQEAWVTAGMEHPGIVPVHELGRTEEGVPYYTMRFVRGERSLEDAIAKAADSGIEDRLTLLEPFLKVCDTIGYAHGRGVIHRDLKPENIALGEYGEVVVLDWGLAKMREEPDVSGEVWQDRIREYRDSSALHTHASALGTPGYMSPEAALGRVDEVDETSDVYSLGVILYRILTGRLPFTFESYGELIAKLREETPVPPVEVDDEVPAVLSRIASAALERDRESRTATAVEMATAVRAWQAGSALDAEVNALVREARGALDAAGERIGAARLREIDRALAAATRAKSLRPEAEEPRTVAAEARSLRERGIKEREAAARKRTFRRTGVVALAILAVVSIVALLIIDDQRKDALGAKFVALIELTEAVSEQGAAEFELGIGYARFAERLANNGATGPARVAAMKALTLTYRFSAWRSLVKVQSTWAPSGRWFEAVEDPASIRTLALVGERLHAGFGDGRVFEYDLSTGRIARTTPGQLPIETAPARREVASADGSSIAVRDAGRVGILDAETREAVRHLDVPAAGEVRLVWAGECLIVACDKGPLLAVRRSEGPVVSLVDGEALVNAGPVAVSPDGSRLYSVVRTSDESADPGIREWRLSDVPAVGRIGPEETGIAAMAITADHRRVAWGGEAERGGLVRIASVDGSGAVLSFVTERRVTALAWSPDASRLYAGDSGGRVVRLDAKTGRDLGEIGRHPGTVDDLVVTPDGQTVYSVADREATVRAWNTSRGDGAAIDIEGRHAIRIALSPDGTRLYVLHAVRNGNGPEDGKIAVFETGTHTKVADFAPTVHHEDLAVSPDGRLLLVGATPLQPLALDATTGEVVIEGDLFLVQREHTVQRGARGIALSPDGKHMVTTSEIIDGEKTVPVIVVWEADTRKRRAALPVLHTGKVHGAAFVPGDPPVLLTCGADGIRTWRLPVFLRYSKDRLAHAEANYGLRVKDFDFVPATAEK